MDKSAHDQFINDLRSALHYLYDFDQLRRSRLADLLGVADRVDTPALLQKLLIDAIEAMKPDEKEPTQSDAWMVYELLFFRFIRGYERDTVANQLGFSPRQLSREQRAAIETLAVHLWAKVQTHSPDVPARDITATISEPAEWLVNLPPEKPGSFLPVVRSVIDLAASLAVQNQVQLRLLESSDRPDRIIPQSALRHALLNVLDVLIQGSRGGEVLVETEFSATTAALCCSGGVSSSLSLLDSEHPNLDMAQRLLASAGGKLQVEPAPGRITIWLSLPTLEQVPVVVIDDNSDVIQLFMRYVEGTRYSIVGIQQPGEALAAIQEVKPRIIVLDVMMPGIDGWDILTMLRQNPASNQTPVIICSILPLSSLALSLGADEFLQKPVLPENFIQALDHQMGKKDVVF